MLWFVDASCSSFSMRADSYSSNGMLVLGYTEAKGGSEMVLSKFG